MADGYTQSNISSHVDFFSWNPVSVHDFITNLFTLSNLFNLLIMIVIFHVFIFPFFGPAIFTSLMYINAFILRMYTKAESREFGYATLESTEKGRNMVIKFIEWVSWLWHDYEIVGWENIPQGPVIYIFYHGQIPIDQIYFITSMWKQNLAPFCGVVSKEIASVKGWLDLHHVFNVFNYSMEECIEHLKEGGHLFIAPGGHRERRFSDNKYKVYLQNRNKFIQMALETNATIIPVFTRNIQEVFWIPFFLKPFVTGKYMVKNLPILPMAGGLPAKLTTVIGKPITFDQDLTEEQLVEKMKSSLQEHIDKHQRIPGSRIYAILERWVESLQLTINKVEERELNISMDDEETNFVIDDEETNFVDAEEINNEEPDGFVQTELIA